MATKILIYGETDKENLTTSTKEILGIGKKLADTLAGEVVGVFIGEQVKENAQEAISFGVDKVVLVENSELRDYQPELYLAVMEKLCKEIEPDILLMSHNFIGAELAPRLACRLKGGLTTDCVDLAIDQETKQLLRTKPIYGGNITAVYCSAVKPQIATIRDKVFPALEKDDSRKGEIISFVPDISFSIPKIKYIKKVTEDFQGKKLEESEVIVCGGRGMGSQEAFAELDQLAKILNGALGGTRPTVEKGWIHSRLQIGLTGVKVSPKLYLAIGVSGSIQHIAGVIGSKIIVAINKDPEANIFNEAHYGVVGDYKEILPAFKEKIRELVTSP